jgi:hypothetical protein
MHCLAKLEVRSLGSGHLVVVDLRNHKTLPTRNMKVFILRLVFAVVVVAIELLPGAEGFAASRKLNGACDRRNRGAEQAAGAVVHCVPSSTWKVSSEPAFFALAGVVPYGRTKLFLSTDENADNGDELDLQMTEWEKRFRKSVTTEDRNELWSQMVIEAPRFMRSETSEDIRIRFRTLLSRAGAAAASANGNDTVDGDQTAAVEKYNSAEELNKIEQKLKHCETIEQLEILQRELEQALETIATASGAMAKVADTFIRYCLVDLLKQKEALIPDNPRIVDVDYEIENSKLKSNFELVEFGTRVDGLFEWYGPQQEKVRKTFLSPCFPVVQSSGMGKTKLLYEYKKAVKDKTTCVLIRCLNHLPTSDSGSENAVFDEDLVPPLLDDRDRRTKMLRKLNEILDTVNPGRVVFMFDEAQHLLQGSGVFFRMIRWWIRDDVPDDYQMVAVFSGTSSSLLNFFAEIPGPTSSRNPERYRDGPVGNRLFPPFYDLFTIGCYDDDDGKDAATTDYDRSIYHGRPLFPVMKNNNALTEEAHEAILCKMLLTRESNAWCKDEDAVFSILATRIQMGQVSVPVTSKMVAVGYAGLSMFDRDKDGVNTAQMCHFPDPVCARLAMCMMDGTFQLGQYTGMEKSWWSAMVKDQFSSGFCRSSKGDTAEVFVALYLLFCGDVLRATKNTDNDRYVQFAVPLGDWVRTVMNGGTLSVMPDSQGNNGNFEVSFIQVCRSYLHIDKKILWNQDVLENMFAGGVAYFTPPGEDSLDIFAAIRRRVDGNVQYSPLVIQVKARYENLDKPAILQALNKMESVVADAGFSTGLCILVRWGSREIENSSRHLKLKQEDVVDVGHKIVSKLLVLEKDDVFGLTAAFTSVTSDREELAEIRASHRLVASCVKSPRNDALWPWNGLKPSYRKKTKKEGVDYPVQLLRRFQSALIGEPEEWDQKYEEWKKLDNLTIKDLKEKCVASDLWDGDDDKARMIQRLLSLPTK